MLRELVLEELGSQWFINEETPAPRPASAVGSGAILGLWAKFAYDNYGSSYVVKTVVHTVIAVSAEYGFALATVGTSMTGPSQVLETWVDTLFLAETSLLTATSLLNSSGIIEEGKQLIKSCQAAWTSLPQGLAAFYIAIKTIASNIVKNVAVVSYGLHQIAESIKKYLKTSIENIENYIKVLIPDATIGTAAAVAVSGLIGFVGIIVPHTVRLLAGASYRLVLPLSVLLGAVFLVAADIPSRVLSNPAETPIGVITAFFGAPFFLILLRSREASR